MGTSTWELFQAGQEPRDVRREVLTSWRRSQFSGVDPEYVEVPYVETDRDTQFARVAVPIMAGMAELLVGDRSCLALSDASGSVIWRWVSEPMLRGTLDELSVVEGFNFGEEFVGTNGLGTALETGTLAVVHGSEHYVHRFHDVTCVAAPVRHPITRRTVGAVNVTCRATDTNSLLAVVVRKLVEEIRSALHDRATARERRLLSAFLDEQRRATGPIAVVGDGLIITNPQAADLGLDKLGLWDEIRSRKAGGDQTGLALPADLTADVRLVGDGGSPTGAVLTVAGPAASRPAAIRRPARAATGPPDAGTWKELATRAARLTGPVAVIGEAGSGKATVLQRAFGVAPDGAGDPDDPVVLDAAAYPLDPTGWPARLRQAAGRGPVVLRHAELLDTAAVRVVVAALEDPAARSRLGLTVTVADGAAPEPPAMLLIDTLTASTLTVPPLRRNPDELVALARAELHRHAPALSFSPDALAALRRHHWPGNVAELVRVVRDAARDRAGETVGLSDLTPDLRHARERRALTPLEHAEASVIATVLHEHHGNKTTTARELGISRTALYAKIRSYRL